VSLLQNNFPFPAAFNVSDEEASWMTSVTNLGYPLGTLASGWAAAAGMSPKSTGVLLLSGTYVLSYSLVAFAADVRWLIAARLVAGVCQGLSNSYLYVYAYDLCSNNRRATVLGVLFSVSGYSSTLLTYILGVFLDW